MSSPTGAPPRPGRPGRGSAARTGPQPYDFRRPATLPREQVRAVQLACETFARRYTTLFTSSLRVVTHVTLVSIEQVTYEEYVSGLSSPTLMALLTLEPMVGTAILEFSLPTAMVSVDHLLGGPGGPQPQRPLSELEIPLLRGLLNSVLEELRFALEPLAAVRPVLGTIEYNPQFVQVASPQDAMVVASFEMRVGTAEECVATLCIPLAMILPSLTEDPDAVLTPVQRADRAQAYRDMAESLQLVPVEVAVRFVPTRMRPEQLVSLRPGDVLRLEHPLTAPLEVRAAGLTFAHAVAGSQGTRLACMVIDPIREATG
jgi:flagellar motor switch protein FliM